jgi:hypothetical protein
MRRRICYSEKRAQQKPLITMKEKLFFPEREYVGKFPFQ